MRLFDRQIAVTLTRSTGFFTRLTGQGLETRITGLRVAFVVEKELGEDPNTCEIVISNLSRDSRAALEKKKLHVRLEAGYDGNLERLFAGDVRFVEHVKEGAEWLTTIQLGDGERAYRHARVNRSFKPGTPARVVLNEIASQMGLDVPKTATAAKELARQYVAGISVDGKARSELTRLLAPYDLEWSIQDGKLQILKRGAVRAGEALRVAEDTGMIGSPAFGSPPEPGDPPVLRVKSLLLPRALPAGKVKVESREVNGLFKLDRVIHQGDTHSTVWETDLECTPL